MSDRIDLTQFEGIWDKKHNLFIEKTPTDGFHWSVLFENDVEASMSVPSWYGKVIHEEADRFYHAIDKLPDLLAELKRCYEEIDKLRKRPVSISCEHCSHVYEEEYLHEMLEMGPNGECVMCLEEASE